MFQQLDDGAAKASADAVAPLEDVTYIPKTDITRLEEFNLFQVHDHLYQCALSVVPD
ncbi:hypothetical protein DPMN_046662 [Dreissena polymorpha]|uniref:Uncharacterized protein n=1 Tax=Dreissena polymorpha TaxID=45954 RepID=A0A9D4D868_DREPO|nr:hypothetical protein DPMN_046662 [Dreissena polymorpha]